MGCLGGPGLKEHLGDSQKSQETKAQSPDLTPLTSATFETLQKASVSSWGSEMGANGGRFRTPRPKQSPWVPVFAAETG